MGSNPNDPMTQATSDDHWHKVAAVLVAKMGGHVVVTPADIDLLPPNCGVASVEMADGLHLHIVDEATADRLRAEGVPT